MKEILTVERRRRSQVTADEPVDDYLGVPKYRYGEAELEDQVGVVTGLAWTEVGGEILTIEGVMMPGKGKMTVTGNLRDVMKESIQAAQRLRALALGRLRHPAVDVREEGHPRARAGGRDAEGWPVGRRRHGRRRSSRC